VAGGLWEVWLVGGFVAGFARTGEVLRLRLAAAQGSNASLKRNCCALRLAFAQMTEFF